jgi:hypothetical protein
VIEILIVSGTHIFLSSSQATHLSEMALTSTVCA